MGALDAFYTTWSKARQTFGQGVPQDGSRFDGSAQLQRFQDGVTSAAPDERWQGPASTAYAAKNKSHAETYGKLANLDRRMSVEVTNAANVVTAGRENLDRTKKWVDSMAAAVPAGTSAADRDAKLVTIANQGISKVSEIVKTSNDAMNVIGGRLNALKGEFQELSDGKPGLGADTPRGKPDIMTAWNDRKTDEELVPDDMEGLVRDALGGNQDAAAKVDKLLNSIDKDQLGPSSAQHPLTPVQAELVGQLQAQMKPMSMTDLAKVREKLGSHKNILSNAMQVMSDPDVKYPRHDGDGPEIVTPGRVSNDGVLPGDKGALPDGVQSALNAKLDLSGPGLAPHGVVPTPFETTESGKGLADLSAIIREGDPKFQQGSELDRSLMSRGQEIVHGFGQSTWGDSVAQDIFESAGRDKIVDHDMFTKNPSFIQDVLTHPWIDDGKAASTLTDWIKQDANSPDPSSNIRAGETARALADYMGTHKDPLLNMNGGTQPLGQVNPDLTQSLARAMSPYLDEITGRPLDTTNSFGLNSTHGFGVNFDNDDAKSPKAVNVLTALNTDDGAAKIINEKSLQLQNAYINEYAKSVIDNPEYPADRTALDAAGKLKGITENALVSASNDVIQDDNKARQRVITIINTALDTVSALPGSTGDVIGMASPTFKEFVSSFEETKPSENTPTRSSVAMQTMLADSFLRAGLGPEEGIERLSSHNSDGRNGLDIPAKGTVQYDEYMADLQNYLEHVSGSVDSEIRDYDQAYRDALTPTVDE